MKDDAPTRILLVDDDAGYLDKLESMLHGEGYRVEKHTNPRAALDSYYHKAFDVVVLGFEMKAMSGTEATRLLKMMDPAVVSLCTAESQSTADIRTAMKAGAYDYLSRPFTKEEFVFAVKRATKRRGLLEINIHQQKNLERLVSERTRDLLKSFDAAIFGLAKLVEYRDEETGFHLERLSDISAVLARQLAKTERYADQISEGYINHISRSAPLHDIGKVGIPDRILLKPGKLTREEFEIIKFHPLIGAEAIKEIQGKMGQKRFFNMGMLIAKHHHERWNGSGYPEGLKGNEIPLSARIVALADVYDALTSERPYKAAMSHAKTRSIILEERGEHFDPEIVDAFIEAQDEIEAIINKWRERLFRGEDTINVIIRNVRDHPEGGSKMELRPDPATKKQKKKKPAKISSKPQPLPGAGRVETVKTRKLSRSKR
jgi:putative two-component system response regulator